eukprot:COSAG01_NODE_858_length_13069_cov_23.641943_4_plen_31_part_00
MVRAEWVRGRAASRGCGWIMPVEKRLRRYM